MEKDERLEALSDKARKGQPIGLGEAVEVVQYQALWVQEKPTLWTRLLNWWNG